MPTHESTTTIEAPAKVVWSILWDVVNWPEWLPTVSKVEPLDDRALRPGARFVVHQPALRPVTWTASETDAPRCFVWVAGSPGLRMTAEHRIEAHSNTACRVVLRFTFAGLLGSIVGRLFASVTRRYLEQEAAALKAKAEAHA